MYSALVLDHFHHPRNVGPLEGATHYGVAGIPGEGPYLELWLQVEEGVVRRGAYRTYGCPAAVACGSLLVEVLQGRPLAAVCSLEAEEVQRALLSLLRLPEGKEECAARAAEALRRALET